MAQSDMETRSYRILEILIYKLLGPFIPAAISIGLAVNDEPLWKALIAVVIYAGCMGGIAWTGRPDQKSHAVRDTLVFGGISLVVTLVAYFVARALA